MTIPLEGDEDAVEERFKAQFAERIDVVVDFLWGMSAERLLIAGAKAGPDAVPPADHIWTTSQLGWLAIDDDLPRWPLGHGG